MGDPFNGLRIPKGIEEIKNDKIMNLVLKQIHRVISFKHKQWLELYIGYNTDKRQQAKNEFDKYSEANEQ